MKKGKKILAVLFSLVMMLTMNMTVFAATISGPSNSAYSDHTYEVYQIFTGKYADGKLTNLRWGENNAQYQTERAIKQVCGGCGAWFDTADEAVIHTMKDFLDECQNYSSKAVDIPASVPSNVTDALAAVNSASDTEKLNVIEPYVNFESEPYGTVTAGSALEDVPDGYYLIKDVDQSQDGENDSYTLYVVAMIGDDLTITPKADVPTFEKKLKDMDDTTNTTTDWQDAADWDMGDKIPFQLKGTVADDYDAYTTYTFVFHDQEAEGLTFDPESVVVKVDGSTIGTGYEVVTEGLEDGCTFEIRFANLKDIDSVHAGSEITAEYSVTLSESAVMGSAGNLSKAKLEFSNNPNSGQTSTGETPWDTVAVYTYKTVVNKVDSENEPLAGAAFTLEKNMNGTWTTVKEFSADDSTTAFSFDGLDDGNYRLTETTTPDGYNSIDPIEFTITAEHSVTADEPALTSLDGSTEAEAIVFTADKDAGSLTTNVVNQSGVELPETGGIGTRIFYTVGAILMTGAAVVFIMRKRMAK